MVEDCGRKLTLRSHVLLVMETRCLFHPLSDGLERCGLEFEALLSPEAQQREGLQDHRQEVPRDQ